MIGLDNFKWTMGERLHGESRTLVLLAFIGSEFIEKGPHKTTLHTIRLGTKAILTALIYFLHLQINLYITTSMFFDHNEVRMRSDALHCSENACTRYLRLRQKRKKSVLQCMSACVHMYLKDVPRLFFLARAPRLSCTHAVP